MSWDFVKLSELCEIRIGRTPSRANPEFWGTGHNWVSISDLNQGKFILTTKEEITDRAFVEQNCKLVPANTLLLSFKLSLGKVAFSTFPVFTNEAIASLIIKVNNKVSNDYLYFALQSIDYERYTDKAVKGKTLNKKKLALLEIPLPPLGEQKRIAAILDKADQLRNARRQAIAECDEFLKSTFIEMFGDPVINPKGWERYSLYSLANHMTDGPFGSNLKTSHYTEEGIRVIRLNNIGVGEFEDFDKVYISKDHYDSLLRNHCQAGDVIIGTLGEPNLRACIIPNEIKKSLNKADCILFRGNTKAINHYYICALLNQSGSLHLILGMLHGQTRTRISMGQLKQLILPVPPLPLQNKFAEIVKQTEAMKERMKASERELDDNFNSLMQRAFRGEL
jgi:type I restriction enzyme S subunit